MPSLRSEINFKNEIIKRLFTSKPMLHKDRFFPHNSEQIKNFNKNYQKTDNSMKILQGHIDKLVAIMVYIKRLQKKTFFLIS